MSSHRSKFLSRRREGYRCRVSLHHVRCPSISCWNIWSLHWSTWTSHRSRISNSIVGFHQSKQTVPLSRELPYFLIPLDLYHPLSKTPERSTWYFKRQSLHRSMYTLVYSGGSCLYWKPPCSLEAAMLPAEIWMGLWTFWRVPLE